MARAVLGSVLGSAVGFLILVAGPQGVQQLAVFAGTTWPAAFAFAGGLAYLGGFVANSERPGRWTSLAIWAGGWLTGVLVAWAGVLMFGSRGD